MFRGTIDDGFSSTLKPGDRFMDKGYVSTSASPKVAQDFAGPLGSETWGTADLVIYRIRPSAEAASRGVLAGTTRETEWILPSGSSFSVDAVTETVIPSGARHRLVDLTWE